MVFGNLGFVIFYLCRGIFRPSHNCSFKKIKTHLMTLNIIIHNIFVIIFFVRPNIFFSTTFMHIKGVQLE